MDTQKSIWDSPQFSARFNAAMDRQAARQLRAGILPQTEAELAAEATKRRFADQQTKIVRLKAFCILLSVLLLLVSYECGQRGLQVSILQNSIEEVFSAWEDGDRAKLGVAIEAANEAIEEDDEPGFEPYPEQ